MTETYHRELEQLRVEAGSFGRLRCRWRKHGMGHGGRSTFSVTETFPSGSTFTTPDFCKACGQAIERECDHCHRPYAERRPSWTLVLSLVGFIFYLVALLLWALQIRYHF